MITLIIIVFCLAVAFGYWLLINLGIFLTVMFLLLVVFIASKTESFGPFLRISRAGYILGVIAGCIVWVIKNTNFFNLPQ